MMKKSKKGITLVELVICCAVLALLAGAVTAVLMSGEHLFSTSADSASAQMELDVLQTNLLGIIPSAQEVDIYTGQTDIDAIYFSNGNLVIRHNAKETVINDVTNFKYKIIRAGTDPNPTASTESTEETKPVTARAQFCYEVTFRNGQTFDGGFIISNLPYPDVVDALTTEEPDPTDMIELSSKPLCFPIPTSTTEGTE